LADCRRACKPLAEQVFQLIDSVFSDKQLPQFDDDRRPKKNPLNDNFDKQEFKALWSRINRKAAYSVRFDSAELVGKAVKEMNAAPARDAVAVHHPARRAGRHHDYDDLKSGQAFVLKATETEVEPQHSVHSAVKYDLVGKLAEGTQLTRRTVVDILKGLNVAVFAQFKTNPEHFIAEARRLINEQKATMIIEHLAYDPVEERYELDIFTAGPDQAGLQQVRRKLDRHIYDYVLTDSDTERKFVKELDTASEVVVYAKLPRGFLIPTPVGDYNPDWAIAFKEGVVKHVYFVAETKGSMSSMELRKIERDQDRMRPQVLRRAEPEVRAGEREVRRGGQLRQADGVGEVITSLSSDYGLKQERVGITADQAAKLSDQAVESIAEAYALSNGLRSAREGGKDREPMVRATDEPATAFLDRLLCNEVEEQANQFKKLREHALGSTHSIFDQVRKASLALGDTREQLERLTRGSSFDAGIGRTPSVEIRPLGIDNHMAEFSARMERERGEDREIMRLTGQASSQSAAMLQELEGGCQNDARKAGQA
jgi:hypothetical protein